MKRKMTDLAFGGKCGPSIGSFSFPSAAHIAPSAAPKKPPPARNRKSRRGTLTGRPELFNSISPLPQINEFVEIEQQPRQTFQARRIVVQESKRAIFLIGGRRPAECHPVGHLESRVQIATRFFLDAFGELR